MKLRLMMCSAALAAVMASPAWSADEIADQAAPGGLSGYGELFGGYGWDSDNSEEWNYAAIGGSARLNYWVTPTISSQFDVWINHFSTQDYDFDYSAGGAGVHLNMRNADYLVGGLVSYGGNGDYDGNFVNAGIEAQRYFGDWTLYGQAGYTAETTSDDASAWYGHAAARYFFNPDLMVEANAGYASVDAFGYTDSQTKWGARIEWKPKDTLPVSLFAGYQGHNDDWNDGYKLTGHTIFAGLRIYFGQDSLMDNDRQGASLVDYNPMFGVNEPWDSF